ncbi:hypothetical protein CBL_00020 [Carabus blaptoides fortunei]
MEISVEVLHSPLIPQPFSLSTRASGCTTTLQPTSSSSSVKLKETINPSRYESQQCRSRVVLRNRVKFPSSINTTGVCADDVLCSTLYDGRHHCCWNNKRIRDKIEEPRHYANVYESGDNNELFFDQR